MKTPKRRVIGTTATQIDLAEQALDRKLPSSFRHWLLENNGRSLGALTIFPVYDPRDPRSTWDSIVRNFEEAWAEWRDTFAGSGPASSHLLPFAAFGTGDFLCFDYLATSASTEPPVVLWSHETGACRVVAESFAQFLATSDE